MARTPDKPGTWRVKPKGGYFVLSGVDKDGNRIKVSKSSRMEAESLAKSIFGERSTAPLPSPAFSSPDIGRVQPTPVQLDDFGLPVTLRVSPETVASVQQSFGISSNQPAGPKVDVPTAKEVEEKRVKRAKQAKSLMELAGISFAAGDVWLARKVCDRAGKDPVNPNPRQVNDLAEVTKETLAEWFGDREVKPWQMMFLLAIGIPISMLIQSPKKLPSSTDQKLKSVP